PLPHKVGEGAPPPEPARDSSLQMIAPGKVKRIGKGGSLDSRLAILHSIANIEQWAIDLAWDIIARFSTHRAALTAAPLPRTFFSDFVKVASDEAKHFLLVAERLVELGSRFGALPVHGGLWDSAVDTMGGVRERLAIVHMVHEARGLDVNPQTIARFERAGDLDSAERLKIIHNDEITHVACGQKWFTWETSQNQVDRYKAFHEIVGKYFRG
ncbi:hypothetical protein BDK51DRAFT_10801, partial [Blyttiomyces helicus]